MPQVKPEIEAFARIRVVGVGGSGRNAVNHMIETKVRGVDFIVVNTDAQDLQNSNAKKKIHIGKNLTRGLGTGMNAELGKRAAEETKEEIQQTLKGSDMVFIACGMGGGTGTGAGPIVARTARELGALTVGVVTKPFSFEGQQRAKLAETGLDDLRKEVDALIIIPNDRLLATVAKDTTLKAAFAMCDDVLRQAVEGISDLITHPGDINVDFADVRAIMESAGSALIGIGKASGEKRAEEAARMAISSPLLEISINGAKGVLLAVAGGDDLGMLEVQEAAKIVTESVDPNAKIIFGASKDEKLKKGEIKITVIATNFPVSGITSARSGQLFSFPSREREKERDADLSTIGKIYNVVASSGASSAGSSATQSSAEPSSEYESVTPLSDIQRPEPQPEQKASIKKIDDDDEWGPVPSFLRRPKIK